MSSHSCNHIPGGDRPQDNYFHNCFPWKPSRTSQGTQFCKHVSGEGKVVKWAYFALGFFLVKALCVTFSLPSSLFLSLSSLTPLQAPLCPLLTCIQSLSAHQCLDKGCLSLDIYFWNHQPFLNSCPGAVGFHLQIYE